MSDVSAVVNHFSTSNEGFVNTLASAITAGAATVPLSGVTGLVNGTIFVGIIEAGTLKQQVFTGTVNTGTSSITGVKWTRGVNVDHSPGASIVDYVTGTDHNMMTAGILKEHKQTGAHSNISADSISTTTLTIAGKDSSQLTPTGIMSPFAGSTSPAGWLLCDGTAVSRTTYAVLFAVVGTAYGVGDGSTTFTLPDMRGRVPVGQDAGSVRNNAVNLLGQAGGIQNQTLTEAQMPAHLHQGTVDANGNHTHSINREFGSNGNLVPPGQFQQMSTTANSGGTTNAAGNHAHTFTSDTRGSGQAHSIMQPYQNFNYIIKT